VDVEVALAGQQSKTYEIKDKFFDPFQFTLHDVYDCLSHFDEISEKLQGFLHEKIVSQYNRDTSLMYYDVTNYYFEIDKEDEFRKRGASKENRRDPIVQMGLALDRQGIPVAFQTFPGNKHDSETYMPVLKTIKKKYSTDRIIVVADKGLNCGDNIAFSTALGDGYIFSKSVKGASEEFRNFVLNQTGYKTGKEYKGKSRVIPTEIDVTVEQHGKKKKKKKVQIDQKQIILYSEKYAKRSKRRREQAREKAADLIKNPSKYKKAATYGAVAYVNNIHFDKGTGEVIEKGGSLSLNIEKIKEEEKYDGYYAIVTSELDAADDEIIEAYHELWRIEESFKITKSTLDARPVFLSLNSHINAHFLICFIALLVSRLVEIRLGNKYNVEKIIETLGQVECSYLSQNYYLFDFANEVTDDINAVFNVGIGKKIMTLGNIKNNLASVKK
jgi:transposase